MLEEIRRGHRSRCQGAPEGVSVVVVGANHRTAPLELLERMAVSGDRLPKLAERPRPVRARLRGRHPLDLQPHRGVRRRRAVPRGVLTRSATSSPTSPSCRPRTSPTACTSTTTPTPSVTSSRSSPASTRRCRASTRSSARSATRGRSPAPKAPPVGVSTCCSATPSRSASGPAPRRGIAQHVTSVSHAAVIMAGERLGGLAGRKVVLVGAGDDGSRAWRRSWPQAGVAEIVVANRTVANAVEVVAAALAESPDMAARAIGLDDLGRSRRRRPTCCSRPPPPRSRSSASTCSDGAVGRSRRHRCSSSTSRCPATSIPAVADLDGVELLDMDTVAGVHRGRHRQPPPSRSPPCRPSSTRSSTGSSPMVDAREVAPVITAMRQRAEDVRVAELDRFAGPARPS